MPLEWAHIRSIARCVLPVLVGPRTALITLSLLPDFTRPFWHRPMVGARTPVARVHSVARESRLIAISSDVYYVVTKKPAISGSRQARHGSFAARENALNDRSEEHTSELQSLMRISYAVFRFKKK